MLHQVLDICVDYRKAGVDPIGFQPTLACYVPDVSPEIDAELRRPAVLVCPGGGYHFTSDREAEPIALAFAARGIAAFVLRYSVAPMRFPGALLEACEAVAVIRRHAADWRLDPAKIAVCGFSAGGHLAGSVGVHWNHGFVKDALGYRAGEHRPNALLLCYAVLSARADARQEDSYRNLFGGAPTEAECELTSCERQVSADTPPCFLWHTCDDPVVPASNSLVFAEALSAAGVPFELHVYPHGQHGLALANAVTGAFAVEPDCQDWPDRAARWLQNL